MATKRLDVLLFEKGLCESREQAQGLILAGEVWTGQRRLDKPGMKFDENLPLEVRSRGLPFVSRAGNKLQHAIECFKVPVKNRVCLDVGASTGGFTDCLLQHGADHVFAVDVGYGQLDSKLRQNPAVTVVEKTNARFLTLESLVAIHPKAAAIDLLVMDVSFISLEKIILPLSQAFPKIRDWVLLFKPQFEVGRENVGHKGLVKTETAVQDALEAFHTFMMSAGFTRKGGPESSPLAGKKSGNLEYLVHYAGLAAKIE